MCQSHSKPVGAWRTIGRLAPAVALCLSAATAQATRVYFIGNSVTDQVNYDAFKQIVESRGFTHVWGRDMIPGAPLEWIWDHPADGFSAPPFGLYPSALTNFTWDIITLQPFDRLMPSDLDYAGRFISLSHSRSPTAQFYVYARWPRQGGGTFDYLWLRKYTGGWDNTNETKDYFESLTLAMRAAQTNIPPVLMIPVGHVMYELNQKMEAHQIPGYTNIFQLYADGIHLNATGQYIVGCTFFATLYKQNPTGLSAAPYGVTNAAMADVIQRTAWDIVRNNALSGVVVTSALAVATEFLPDGIGNLSYAAALQASGGRPPYKWTRISGTLPPGVALAADGSLAGTPSVASNFVFTAEVTDARWDRSARDLHLNIAPDTTPSVLTTTLSDGARGTLYHQPLQASGGNGNLSWSLIAGALPVGMFLQPDGLLTGTPGVEGPAAFTVRVTDSDPVNPDSGTRALTLNVGAPEPGTLLIRRVEGPIAIDGRLQESFWSPTNALTKLVSGTAGGNAAIFDAVWDDRYLYVAVRVQDATAVSDSADPWDDDSVEIFIDGKHNREVVYNFDDRRLVIGRNNAFYSVGSGQGILHASAPAAGGYAVEAAIPWSNLGQTPYTNMTVGLDVAVNDDDNGGARDGQLVWWGTADNAVNPSGFGGVVLTERTVLSLPPSPSPASVIMIKSK